MDYVNAIIVGIAVGGPYALVGISLSLMFRTTGVLSFAHAAFAMIGGFAFGELATAHGLPPIVAAVGAVLIATGIAVLTERLAIRPLGKASAPVKLIASLGVLAVVTGVITEVFGSQPKETPLLFPSGTLTIGNAGVTYQQLGILGITLAIAFGLNWFLQHTAFGTAIRSVQSNPEAAQLMGVTISSVDRFNWAVGGALSGIVGVLLTPLVGATVATYPLLLSKALAGTLFGGLSSLPLTLLGGLCVGAVESLARIRFSVRGAPELAVLAVVGVMLVARRSWATGDGGAAWQSSDSASPRGPMRRRLVAVADQFGQLRRPTRIVIMSGLITVVLLGSAVAAQSEYWGAVGALSLFYFLEALSMVVLTGWGGQVSLMHGAYVGIGSFMTAWLVGERGWPLELALPAAAVIGVLMGALLGIPALRLSGVQFAIASIVFASAASSWLFELPSLPRNINRGTLFSIDLFDTNHVFVIMLIVSALLFAVVWAVRRSSWWVLLIASRDIPLAVQHFGARPGVVRLVAFTLASFMATLGGAFFGIIATSFSPFNFSLVLSIALLLYAVVGGLETLLGPFVAALAFGLLPQLLQQQSGASATTWPDVAAGALVIALLALRPSGLAALLWPSAGSSTRCLVFGRFDAVVPAALAETDRASGPEARASQPAAPTPKASRPASVPGP